MSLIRKFLQNLNFELILLTAPKLVFSKFMQPENYVPGLKLSLSALTFLKNFWWQWVIVWDAKQHKNRFHLPVITLCHRQFRRNLFFPLFC